MVQSIRIGTISADLPGIDYRGQTNEVDAAVASESYAETEPTITYAGMPWRSSGFNKRRTSANDAWYIEEALSKTTDPAAGDDAADGYVRGSVWINITGNKVWVCTNPAAGAADWRQIGVGGGGGLSYKGLWNADTNTPTITDGVGSAGDWYRVSVGGTWNSITFIAGDDVLYNGSTWQRSTASSAVVSVAGRTGAITLAPADVALSNVTNDAQLRSAMNYSSKTTPAAGDKLVIKDQTSGNPLIVDWSQLPAISGSTVEIAQGTVNCRTAADLQEALNQGAVDITVTQSFSVTSHILIPHGKTFIIHALPNVVISTTSAINIFDSHGADGSGGNVTIRDIEFDGGLRATYTQDPDGGRAILNLFNHTTVTLLRVGMRYSTRATILISDTPNVYVQQCKVYMSSRDALRVYSSNISGVIVVIEDNNVWHCGDDAIAVPIYDGQNNPRYVTIRRNTIINSNGIKVMGGARGGQILIEENGVYAARHYGVALGADAGWGEGSGIQDNITVRNNTIEYLTNAQAMGHGSQVIVTAIWWMCEGETISGSHITNNTLRYGPTTAAKLRTLYPQLSQPWFDIDPSHDWYDPDIVPGERAIWVVAANATDTGALEIANNIYLPGIGAGGWDPWGAPARRSNSYP